MIKWGADLFKKDKNEGYRDKLYKLVYHIIYIGGLIPFAAQFIIPTLAEIMGHKVDASGAEIWNQYVSIILGIVATIMSVVSMYLGFKNADDSAESERRTRDLINKLDDETKEILEQQRRMMDLQTQSLEEQKEIKRNIQGNTVNIAPVKMSPKDWGTNEDSAKNSVTNKEDIENEER